MGVEALDFCGQILSGDAGDGLLTGGVDGEHVDGVGVSKCTAELVQKIKGAGVAVGLEDDEDAAMATLPRGCEGGANFGGMVAVVVDHGDAAGGATKLKAPINSSEVIEAFGNFIGGNFKLAGDGDGGGGVENVMASRDMEFEGAERSGNGVDEEAGEANLN